MSGYRSASVTTGSRAAAGPEAGAVRIRAARVAAGPARHGKRQGACREIARLGKANHGDPGSRGSGKPRLQGVLGAGVERLGYIPESPAENDAGIGYGDGISGSAAAAADESGFRTAGPKRGVMFSDEG